MVARAVLHVALSDSVEAAIPALVPFIGDQYGPIALLPSSLEAGDRPCGMIVNQFDARVLLPVSPFRRMISAPRSRTIEIGHPGASIRSATISATLLDAPRRIAVCDLDTGRVARSGPFVLDLLARYVSPRDRLRILASGSRSSATAEANLAVKIDGAIIAGTFGSVALAVWTEDRIAGELVALALAERKLETADRSFTGPWEDAVVQRATELDLGVRIPGEIELAVVVVAGNAADPGPANVLEHIRSRLGMTSQSERRTGPLLA